MLFLILYFIITATVHSQQISIFFTPQSSSTSLYANNHANQIFLYRSDIYRCSDIIYTHTLTNTQYSQNTPSIINIITNSPLNFTVSTKYNRFAPTLNTSQCNSNCSVSLQYNCPSSLSTSNYFDAIRISIPSIATFSYDLNCNISFNAIYFEWGKLLLIFLATTTLIIAVFMARFDSFDGKGITYNFKFIFIVAFCILLFGLLSLFFPTQAGIILDIISWIFGIIGVSVIWIEFFYKIIKNDCMRFQFNLKYFKVRVVEILGVAFAIPLMVGWWVSGKNFIISDIISMCMVVSATKIFKFVSFKSALVSYFLIASMYITAAVVLVIIYNDGYNQYLLFRINSPFQLQLPSLSVNYGNYCVWISITTIAFPAILVSYLRRFDQSRNTKIYLITCIISYFIGSVIWWICDTFSFYPIPFDAICVPIMIVSFTIFAFKRKELRTIWDGKFYDEEFMDKNQVDNLKEKIEIELTQVDNSLNKDYQDLFFNIQEDSDIAQNSQKGVNVRRKVDQI